VSTSAPLFRWIVAGDFETWVSAQVDPLTGVTGVGFLYQGVSRW
jgi:hypothetical protein